MLSIPLIARFMGPSRGPSGADRTRAGPMLVPWTLLSETFPLVFINITPTARRQTEYTRGVIATNIQLILWKLWLSRATPTGSGIFLISFIYLIYLYDRELVTRAYNQHYGDMYQFVKLFWGFKSPSGDMNSSAALPRQVHVWLDYFKLHRAGEVGVCFLGFCCCWRWFRLKSGMQIESLLGNYNIFSVSFDKYHINSFKLAG